MTHLGTPVFILQKQVRCRFLLAAFPDFPHAPPPKEANLPLDSQPSKVFQAPCPPPVTRKVLEGTHFSTE